MCFNYLVIVVENGHGLANGDSGIIVGTGTQGTSMVQVNRSFCELNLNVEPIGTLSEHGMLSFSHTYGRYFFTIFFLLTYSGKR